MAFFASVPPLRRVVWSRCSKIHFCCLQWKQQLGSIHKSHFFSPYTHKSLSRNNCSYSFLLRIYLCLPRLFVAIQTMVSAFLYSSYFHNGMAPSYHDWTPTWTRHVVYRNHDAWNRICLYVCTCLGLIRIVFCIYQTNRGTIARFSPFLRITQNNLFPCYFCLVRVSISPRKVVFLIFFYPFSSSQNTIINTDHICALLLVCSLPKKEPSA